MKKGFIMPLVLLTILAFAAYYLYKNYAESPNTATVQTAENFLKYPRALDWQLKSNRNFCLQKEACSQPISITFTSLDTWNDVYVFYKGQLTQRGWQTNTAVITSVPSGAIFTNSQNCEAYLTKNSLGFLGMQKPDNGKFIIKISCK